MSQVEVIDPLVASWHETVQALQTVEEREELSHFLRHDLRHGVGAGILRGLFLLLKANRLYLEQLPGTFNQELVEPMRDQFLRLERTLAFQVETQTQMVARNEKAAETSLRAMKGMESLVPKVATVVQDAVDKIETKALTRQITDTVMKSTVEPVAETNRELQKMLKLLTELVEKVKEGIEILRKIAWERILWASLGIAFTVWAIVFIFAYQGMKHSFDASLEMQNQKLQALAGAIEKAQGAAIGNQWACDQLSHLQTTIEVKPLSDEPGHYVLILPGAESAQVMPDGKGVVSFQGTDIGSLLQRQMEENRKLLGH